MDNAIQFYENELGWHRSSMSQGDIVFFDCNGLMLALYPLDKLAEDALSSSDGSGFKGITLAINMRSKEDVDSTFALLKSSSAKIVKAPEEVFWGGYSGYFEDPDGHLFEIAYNPFITLDAKGEIQLKDK